MTTQRIAVGPGDRILQERMWWWIPGESDPRHPKSEKNQCELSHFSKNSINKNLKIHKNKYKKLPRSQITVNKQKKHSHLNMLDGISTRRSPGRTVHAQTKTHVERNWKIKIKKTSNHLITESAIN
jgi:hypothetical protein